MLSSISLWTGNVTCKNRMRATESSSREISRKIRFFDVRRYAISRWKEPLVTSENLSFDLKHTHTRPQPIQIGNREKKTSPKAVFKIHTYIYMQCINLYLCFLCMVGFNSQKHGNNIWCSCLHRYSVHTSTHLSLHSCFIALFICLCVCVFVCVWQYC
jgi:hypothetical protein